jgi:hypothetical protein
MQFIETHVHGMATVATHCIIPNTYTDNDDDDVDAARLRLKAGGHCERGVSFLRNAGGVTPRVADADMTLLLARTHPLRSVGNGEAFPLRRL